MKEVNSTERVPIVQINLSMRDPEIAKSDFEAELDQVVDFPPEVYESFRNLNPLYWDSVIAQYIEAVTEAQFFLVDAMLELLNPEISEDAQSYIETFVVLDKEDETCTKTCEK